MVAFRAKVDGDMAGKIPTTFAISCNRPTALWASQPSLLSCSLFSTFLFRFSHFPILSPIFTLFTLFALPFFFFSFFPQFSTKFPSPSPTFRFFQLFLAKATRLHVTPLSAMCPTRHRILRRTLHVVKEDFCMFLGIFRHIQKKGPNFVKSPKREGFNFHVIGTLSFFFGEK